MKIKTKSNLLNFFKFVFIVSLVISIVFIFYITKNNLDINFIYDEETIFYNTSSLIFNVFDNGLLGQFLAIFFNNLFYSLMVGGVFILIMFLVKKLVNMLTSLVR